MRWVEIALNANPDTEDAITDILISEGCAGTATFSVPDALEDLKICGYLPVDDRLEARLLIIKERAGRLVEYGLSLPDPEVTITWVEDDEWATAWKKYFKPLKLGRIVIKPTWEDYPATADDLIIELDPGMAFGTGNHDTTQLCVLALQDYVIPGCTVLDAGCGSGILAMSAAKLGAGKVLAFDNDPIAVSAATANVNKTALDDKITVMLGESPLISPDKSDLVIANIIPNVIINMASELADRTAPGGILIVSGIVEDRVDDVRAALESIGMIFVEDRRQTVWCALVFRQTC
jgi:ribosomal protein L11 methyltransferase